MGKAFDGGFLAINSARHLGTMISTSQLLQDSACCSKYVLMQKSSGSLKYRVSQVMNAEALWIYWPINECYEYDLENQLFDKLASLISDVLALLGQRHLNIL